MQPEERGFSLIEILVVMALMGVVVTAIYALYLNTQRTANTSEEIVEVQQNLRFAMDRIARDIRMAGFLVPSNVPPISIAGADTLSINTALTSGKYARIVGVSPSSVSTDYDFTVASAEMVDLFESGVGGDYVRIVRPGGNQPLNRVFRVQSKSRSDLRLTLRGFDTQVEYLPGDIIVHVSGENAPFPQVITYRLEENTDSSDPSIRMLVRETSAGQAEVAGKITALELDYVSGFGGEITAVRVTLTGATDETRTGGENYSGVKTRQLESVIKLRNR